MCKANNFEKEAYVTKIDEFTLLWMFGEWFFLFYRITVLLCAKLENLAKQALFDKNRRFFLVVGFKKTVKGSILMITTLVLKPKKFGNKLMSQKSMNLLFLGCLVNVFLTLPALESPPFFPSSSL